MSTVGCSSFSPATIVSSGRLTGKRCRALSPEENVLLSAAEMCVGLEAATTAMTRGVPARVGSRLQSRAWKRTFDA